MIEQDAKEKGNKKAAGEANASDGASGGVETNKTDADRKTEAEKNAAFTQGAKESAENQEGEREESAEEDARAVRDITRMWKQFKESHPDAKVEDFFGSRVEPKGGNL